MQIEAPPVLLGSTDPVDWLHCPFWARIKVTFSSFGACCKSLKEAIATSRTHFILISLFAFSYEKGEIALQKLIGPRILLVFLKSLHA